MAAETLEQRVLASLPGHAAPEEVAAAVENARRKQKANKPAAGFVRADQVKVSPIAWAVRGWLAQDTFAAIVGQSGSLKSFLAIDLACSIATGTPWNGCEVRQGAAFILAGEGRNGLRKRIQGWSEHKNVSIEGAPLYLASQLPRLDHLTTAGILQEIDNLRESTGHVPALVIIDTLARAIAGDENSATDMGQLVECADWIREHYPGCCVLLVHHTGHGNKGRARGSSAFYSALDSEVVMKTLKSGDVQMFSTKEKDWDKPRPLQFRRHKVEITVPGLDEPASTLVLVNTQMSRPEDRSSEVSELKASGMTVREIAEETGLSKSKVDRLLKDAKPVWEQEFD